MGRNYLAHASGDAINAVLAAAGYNFRRLLAWLRLFDTVIDYDTALGINPNQASSLNGRGLAKRHIAPAAIAISTQPKTFGPISSTSSCWYAVR